MSVQSIDVRDGLGRICNRRARSHSAAGAERAMLARGLADYELFRNPAGRGVMVFWHECAGCAECESIAEDRAVSDAEAREDGRRWLGGVS